MAIDESFLADLQKELQHQLRWKRVMCGAYFVSSAVANLASGAATIVSAMGISFWAAVLSGSATALFGIEKAMLFREKWAHHLSTATRLDSLRLRYVHGHLDLLHATDQMAAILSAYADKASH